MNKNTEKQELNHDSAAKISELRDVIYKERRFHNMIVHELRTQVGIISNLSEMLLDDGLAQSHPFYKRALKQTSERVVQLSQDFLEVDQFINNQVELKVERLNLIEFMDVFVMPYVNMAAKKGLLLKLEVDENCPKLVQTDVGRLGQILSNLIDNAIKYTEVGHVNIHVHYNAAQPLPLVFDVIDSGIGIDFNDDKARSKIFTEYARLDNALDKKGVGLGLWIIKNLAQLMGGSIEIKTDHVQNADGGTCFRLLLPTNVNRKTTPLMDVPIKPRKVKNRDNKPKINGPILMVEDNRLNQHIIATLLEGAKIEFDVASSLAEANYLMNIKKYSLILADLNLPDGRGEDLVKTANGAKIIALTAEGDFELADRLDALGFIGFIEKPIVIKNFMKTLFAHLESSDILS